MANKPIKAPLTKVPSSTKKAVKPFSLKPMPSRTGTGTSTGAGRRIVN